MAPCCLRVMWNTDGSLEGGKREHASVTVKENRLFLVHFRDVLRCREVYSGLLKHLGMCVCVSALRPLVLSERLNTWRTQGSTCLYMCMKISDQPLRGVTWESNQCLVHSSCFLVSYFYQTCVCHVLVAFLCSWPVYVCPQGNIHIWWIHQQTQTCWLGR